MFILHAPLMLFVVRKLFQLVREKGVAHPQTILFIQFTLYFTMRVVAAACATLIDDWYSSERQDYVFLTYNMGIALLVSCYMTFVHLWSSVLARFEARASGFFTISSRVAIPLAVFTLLFYLAAAWTIDIIPPVLYLNGVNVYIGIVIIYGLVSTYRTATEVKASLKATGRQAQRGDAVVLRITSLAYYTVFCGIAGIVSMVLLTPAVTNGSFTNSLTCELGIFFWRNIISVGLFSLAWSLRGFSADSSPSTTPMSTSSPATPSEPAKPVDEDLKDTAVLPGEPQ